MNFLQLIFLLSFILGGTCLTARWSDRIVRETIITPDGNGVDFEVLEDVLVKISKHTLNYYPTVVHAGQEHVTLPSTYTERNGTKLAIDEYVSVGRHKEATVSVEVSAVCDLCASFVHLGGPIIVSKNVWPKAVELLRKTCPTLFGYSEPFCNQTVMMFYDVWTYALQEMIKSPYAVCSKVMKGCGVPDQPFKLWKVELPERLNIPPPQKPMPPQTGSEKEKLSILYVTDLHIDPQYAPDSSARCKEPMCCRNTSVPKADEIGAGYWGDYRMCDVPLWAFEDMLRYINTSHADDIDFVIVNGDSPPHDFWMLNAKQTNMEVIRMVADRFAEKLPGKPLYFALGNHDPAPVNMFPFPGDPERFSIQYLFDDLESIWSKWLDPSTTSATIKKAGFYTTVLRPGFRLITLNNNYCYFQNMLLYGGADVSDPYGQLEWLVGLLTEAEKAGERVIIIGHIQPGDDDCLQAYSWNYYRIISRFAHVIAGQFFGHVHKDFFVMYYDAETLTVPKSVSFVGPPGTMFPLNNMAFRVYDFDANNFTLLNFRQYYADIGEANASGDKGKMNWQLQYSAKESYSMPDMSAESWDDLTTRMRKNATLHDLYKLHYTVNLVNATEKCVMECSQYSICTIYHALSNVGRQWCDYFMSIRGGASEDNTGRKCSRRFAKRSDSTL